MPNFDAGHYFLTTLAPIRKHRVDDEEPESPISKLRRLLERLPTARQSPASEESEAQSPFAKSLRTHLCRFVIIDDTIFNGRVPADPILSGAGIRPDPIEPQHVDRLPCAYLMFTADFDATTEPGQRLPDTLTRNQQDRVRDDYLRELWEIAEPELREIYGCCQAFNEQTIKNGDDFARYLARCQVETCMPYNDYYLEMPKVSLLPVKTIAAVVLIPLAVFLLAGGSWLIGLGTWLGLPAGLTALIALAVTCASLYGCYRFTLAHGNKPWPAAEFGDLPSVLKGLYIQQHFARFVEENQGKPPEEVYAAFGAFLETHKPEDKLDRTQPPGVVRSA